MNEMKLKNDLIEDKDLDLPPYIDQSKFVKNKQGHYLLQFTGWTFWSFLFVPLFTLILWLYQGNLIRNYIFAEKFDVQLLNIMWLAALVIFFGATLLLWASFNWLRFRKQHAKKIVLNVNNAMLSKYLSITPQELEDMQASKRVVLHYDENGELYDYQMNCKYYS
ncbi:MAG: poly-beta-1,6-N-acetyl-D-glucosamine biosynthesis protein PgaD [Acinetobacter sp.]|nr:poly-beta-1,6-N-acetyl-D-glucosamine biosynthesis protein PgaD [Acinetobacter sp.]